MITARIALSALALALSLNASQAQVWYDGTGNRHDWYRGTVEPNPMSADPQSFVAPPLPQVPDVSQGIDEGPGPYGTAIAPGPSGYPCTMPGCP
jgi:hypothetical protein